MDGFIAWCAFFGAWLLFAGPIQQAALELREEGIERDRITATASALSPPSTVSPWWWLLPPVHYLLASRRARTHREAVFAAIDPSDRADLVNYLNKARGWLLVGLGGLLIAVKETWELSQHYDWPDVAFWVLAVGTAMLCASYTAASVARSRQALESGATTSEPHN